MTNPAFAPDPLNDSRVRNWTMRQARARSGYTSARISRLTMAAARALLDARGYAGPSGLDELLLAFVEDYARRHSIALPHHPKPERQASTPAKRKARRGR